MTYQPVAPAVVSHKDSILFLAEAYVSAASGNLTITIVRNPGFSLEATVKRGDETILTERITLEPTIQNWVTDLLNRAGKERSS